MALNDAHAMVILAEAFPAEKYDFRPTSGAFADVRTFGEQVKHVATMMYMTAAIVLQEKSPYGPGTNDNGPDSVQGKEEIVAYLKQSIAYARRAMASLDERNQLDGHAARASSKTETSPMRRAGLLAPTDSEAFTQFAKGERHPVGVPVDSRRARIDWSLHVDRLDMPRVS